MKKEFKEKLKEQTIQFILLGIGFVIVICTATYFETKIQVEMNNYSDIVDDNMRHKEIMDIIKNCK